MKYYISETPLRLREYGRNIQSMVEYMKTIEDKEVRTAVAHEVVYFMTCLKPSIKENPDYKQMLWDYLYLIADGDLDVEAPYEKPEHNPLHHPVGKRLPYPNEKPTYKAYGKNLELMAAKALEMEEGPIRDEYINMLASAVRMALGNNYDRSGTSPEAYIASQILRISGGKLTVDPDKLRIYKGGITHPHHKSRSNNKKGKKGGGNKGRGKSRSKRKR